MSKWVGVAVPLSEGDLGTHLTQCRLGRGLPPYQVASCSIQPFRRNRYGPKMGAAVPLRDRCPVCYVCHLSVSLSVCNVGVLWLNVWMDQEFKMPLRMQDVGLGSGDIVLHGDSATPTERGTVTPPPAFRPTLLWQFQQLQRPLLFGPCLFGSGYKPIHNASAQATLC